jgi:hypothetical protein
VYANVFAYVGTFATGSNGGSSYFIAGPDWNGQVPEGLTKIWPPTNLTTDKDMTLQSYGHLTSLLN